MLQAVIVVSLLAVLRGGQGEPDDGPGDLPALLQTHDPWEANPMVMNGDFEMDAQALSNQPITAWVVTVPLPSTVRIIDSSSSGWGGANAKGRFYCMLQNIGLNSLPGARIAQNVSFHIPGMTYELSFFAAKRAGFPDPSLKVTAGEQELANSVRPVSTFAPIALGYTAKSTTVEISFENVAMENDTGVYIDRVSIAEATTAIPDSTASECCTDLSAMCVACKTRMSVAEICAQPLHADLSGCERLSRDTIHQKYAHCVYSDVMQSGQGKEMHIPLLTVDLGECQDMCRETLGCLHFTFWQAERTCHLFNISITDWKQHKGAVSGPPVCVAAVQVTIRGLSFAKLEDVQRHRLASLLAADVSDAAALPATSVRDEFGKSESVSMTPSDEEMLARMFVQIPAGLTLANISEHFSDGELRQRILESLRAVNVTNALLPNRNVEDINVVWSVIADTDAQCYLEATRYEPSLSHVPIVADSVPACQAACLKTDGCVYFTFHPTQGGLCSFQDASAVPARDMTATAGPAVCSSFSRKQSNVFSAQWWLHHVDSLVFLCIFLAMIACSFLFLGAIALRRFASRRAPRLASYNLVRTDDQEQDTHSNSSWDVRSDRTASEQVEHNSDEAALADQSITVGLSATLDAATTVYRRAAQRAGKCFSLARRTLGPSGNYAVDEFAGQRSEAAETDHDDEDDLEEDGDVEIFTFANMNAAAAADVPPGSGYDPIDERDAFVDTGIPHGGCLQQLGLSAPLFLPAQGTPTPRVVAMTTTRYSPRPLMALPARQSLPSARRSPRSSDGSSFSELGLSLQSARATLPIPRESSGEHFHVHPGPPATVALSAAVDP